MISISLTPSKCDWSTLSFASTLYLCPVLDLLLAKIPSEWHAEIRLGLQEALVNAAKHGNKLDPSKTVVVQFSVSNDTYSWVISDEGNGFVPHCSCDELYEKYESMDDLPPDDSENGRGLCILNQIFDQVHWNSKGTQLRLCKQVTKSSQKMPLVC